MGFRTRLALAGVDALIRLRFPHVPTLTTAQLAEWLADPVQPRPLLLDVRGADEYAVSHLPGARHVASDADPTTALVHLPSPTPIVSYCAVGYRSAHATAALQAAGFRNAWNLRGSIFRWADEGRLLVCDGRPVSVVHPFDAVCALLLRPELRAKYRG